MIAFDLVSVTRNAPEKLRLPSPDFVSPDGIFTCCVILRVAANCNQFSCQLDNIFDSMKNKINMFSFSHRFRRVCELKLVRTHPRSNLLFHRVKSHEPWIRRREPGMGEREFAEIRIDFVRRTCGSYQPRVELYPYHLRLIRTCARRVGRKGRLRNRQTD